MLGPKFSFRIIHQVLITSLLIIALTACSSSSTNNGTEGTVQSDAPNPDPNTNGPTNTNTAPEVLVPNLVTLSYKGIPTIVELEVSDAENNAVRVSWKVESSVNNGDLVIEPQGNFLQAKLYATVAGEYTIGVEATDGIASTYKTFNAKVTNTHPELANVTLEPNPLNASSDITANHDEINDVDGDELTVDYLWRINNSDPIVTNTPTLAPNSVKRDDLVSVEVVVTDGANEVRAQSPDVIVENAPPQLSSVNIEPSTAQAGDNLTASVSSVIDADGDEINSSFQWFINGERLTGQNESVLPSGIAIANDIVTVEVTLSDGIDFVVFSSNELQVTNSSSYLHVEPSEISMNYGSPNSFTAKFVDDDGDAVQTKLVQGPGGFTYNSNTALGSWTPTPMMLSKQESFYVQFSSSDGQTESVKITVINNQQSPPLARSGIPIPGSDFELDIGDLDADGRTEVLSTDSLDHIFTLEFDGESIKQDWLYPFSIAPGENILRLWAYGPDLSQILVVTTKGVSLIESRTELPTRLLDTSDEIAAAAFGDLDADGTSEILLVTPGGDMTKLSTSDWGLSNFGEQLKSTDFARDRSIVLGNIDNDAALEIVASVGQVIDGATGEVQWTHTSPFGNLITIGDVDGDGDTDIVASNRWENVTSYDPIAKTSLWTYNINDFCSLRLYNVDGDPQDELVAGPCQHGSVEIYDGSTGTMVLQDDIDDPDYNSALRSYSLGDLDNDGVDELIFSTGSGSTAEDNMAVVSLASLGDSSSGAVVNVDPSQIYGFKSIGWDTITSGQERAVFILPNTEGGGNGQRVAMLSTSGEFTVSDVVAPNWEDIAEGFVVDSNSDGINEVVVGVGNVRDGEVHHLSLSDFSQLHLHTDLGGTEEFRQPEIISIDLGIDVDGLAKAVIATSQLQMQVYDVASMQADWISGGLSGGRIIDVITINHTQGFDIVAATGSEITLWKKSGNGYAKSNTAGIECNILRHININNEDQIVCVKSDQWEGHSTITLFNSELIKQSELKVDYTITAIKSNPEGELLIGVSVEKGSFYSPRENTLQTIDPTSGIITWKSAAILGQINEISFLETSTNGRPRVAVSTSSAMYILQ